MKRSLDVVCSVFFSACEKCRQTAVVDHGCSPLHPAALRRPWLSRQHRLPRAEEVWWAESRLGAEMLRAVDKFVYGTLTLTHMAFVFLA
jgi:hypothetical protein